MRYTVYKRTVPLDPYKHNVYNYELGGNGRLFLLDTGQICYGNLFLPTLAGGGYLGEGVTHDELFPADTGDLHRLVELYKDKLLEGVHVMVAHPVLGSTMGKLLSNKDIGLE